MSRYYHVTGSFEETISIQKEGIKASHDGYIHLLTRKDITVYVALNQVGATKEFGVIHIDPKGITGSIEPDNTVGELTVFYQKKVKQEVIKPEFITTWKMCWVTQKAIALNKELLERIRR